MEGTGKHPEHRIRKAVLILLLLIVILAAGYYAFETLHLKYQRTFDGSFVTRGDITETLSYSGTLKLIDTASYTAPADSTVRMLYVSEGSKVKSGERLMRLADGTMIRSDLDGRVNAVNFAKGEDVKAGDTLVTVADFDHMQITVRVNEYDINEISVGRDCTVKMTASKETYPCRVTSIDHTYSGNSSISYYQVRVNVDAREGTWPGMKAEVQFKQTKAADTAVLRKTALSFDETNNAYVWIQDENGELQQRYVTLGAYNDDYVQITEGVQLGEVVYKEQENTTTATTLFSMFASMRNRNLQNNSGRQSQFGNNGWGGNGNGWNNNGWNNNGGGSGGPGSRGNWNGPQR